nr:hypothetical protein [Tanacetum cinerariifolium]
MREGENDMWVWGQGHIRRSGEGLGTVQYEVFGMEFACTPMFQVLVKHHTSNGHQFIMSNRHQELTSPEQLASGKDLSNLLIADSLLKTIW